jgi:ABC-type Fe3+-hydroxamate transport system substrate-binding protein
MLWVDQLGREVQICSPPKRIISLVPSQTEFLYDLGLTDELIGVTRFCVHPEFLRKRVKVVGGTKQLKLARIRALEPDLIIANKEENTREMIEELSRLYPVWVSDVDTVESALEMMRSLGDICERSLKAAEIISTIQSARTELGEAVGRRATQKVAYLIWNQPFMAAGSGTYIDAVLDECGLFNVVTASRYPEVIMDDLKAADRVLLSSEPYPFKQLHLDDLKSKGCKAVELVDGEWFSWYGSRMMYSFRSLADWLRKD